MASKIRSILFFQLWFVDCKLLVNGFRGKTFLVKKRLIYCNNPRAMLCLAIYKLQSIILVIETKNKQLKSQQRGYMDIEPNLHFSFIQNSFIMAYCDFFRSFHPTHIETNKSNKSGVEFFLAKPCNCLSYRFTSLIPSYIIDSSVSQAYMIE